VSLNDAVLARLRSAMDPVYDGKVPVDDGGRPLVQRYAVLYASVPVRTAEDLSSTRADRHTVRWQVTSVGEDRIQVEWVATRCRDALMGDPLTAEGWETGAVEHTSSSRIRRDEDIPGDPVFYGVDTYALPATR
jgi:hypothetical protein